MAVGKISKSHNINVFAWTHTIRNGWDKRDIIPNENSKVNWNTEKMWNWTNFFFFFSFSFSFFFFFILFCFVYLIWKSILKIVDEDGRTNQFHMDAICFVLHMDMPVDIAGATCVYSIKTIQSMVRWTLSSVFYVTCC